MKTSALIRIALILVLWTLPFSEVSACVGCRTATADANQSVIQAGFAFSLSVLFMLCVVFVIIGTMGAFIVRTCRRLELERKAGQ